MISDLPRDAIHYATSPRFTTQSTPQKLRRDHSTKAGCWGKLIVFSGQLLYRRPLIEQVINEGGSALIYPQEPHSVEPLNDTEFEIQFYREEAPDAV